MWPLWFALASSTPPDAPAPEGRLCLIRERRPGGRPWVVRVDRVRKGRLRPGRHRCVAVDTGFRVVSITRAGGDPQPTAVPGVWVTEEPLTHAEVVDVAVERTTALRCRPTVGPAARRIVCEAVAPEDLPQWLVDTRPEPRSPEPWFPLGPPNE